METKRQGEAIKHIKVIKTDRNEVRYHCHSDTITVMYKSRQGLEHGWKLAKGIVRKGLAAYE